MTHEEQRVWRIKELQKEDNQLSNYPIPNSEQGRKDLLRGLMNIRIPKPLSKEFLAVQDEYLTEECRRICYITNLEKGFNPIYYEDAVKTCRGSGD